MKQYRRAVVLSVASAVLALTSAVNAVEHQNVILTCKPQHGGIVDCKPKMPWRPKASRPKAVTALSAGVQDVSAAIEGQRMDDSAKILDGMFSGSLTPGSATGAGPEDESFGLVAVSGDWSRIENQLVGIGETGAKGSSSRPVPSIDRGNVPIVKVQNPVVDAVGKGILGAVVKKATEAAIDSANRAADKHVDRDRTQESKEKHGGCRMKGTCDK